MHLHGLFCDLTQMLCLPYHASCSLVNTAYRVDTLQCILYCENIVVH